MANEAFTGLFDAWGNSAAFMFLGEPGICQFACNHSQYVVWQLRRQLVYTMFIGNNHTSFHLWWIENLVKHQKVLKYYKNDWSCIFMSTPFYFFNVSLVEKLLSGVIPRTFLTTASQLASSTMVLRQGAFYIIFLMFESKHIYQNAKMCSVSVLLL